MSERPIAETAARWWRDRVPATKVCVGRNIWVYNADPDSDSVTLTYGVDCATWACGRCHLPLSLGYLENVAAVRVASGVLVVGHERAIHRCLDLDRTEEMWALRKANEMLQVPRFDGSRAGGES